MKLNEIIEVLQDMKTDGFSFNFLVERNSIVLYVDYSIMILTENGEVDKFNAREVNERNHQIKDDESWDLTDLVDYVRGYY